MAYVYAFLYDTRSVAYVGATTMEVSRRVSNHWSHRLQQDEPIKEWLRARDTVPDWVVLEEVRNEDDLALREAFWIALFSSGQGHLLLNVAWWGQGSRGRQMTEAEREKIRQRMEAAHMKDRIAGPVTCECGHESPTARGLSIHLRKSPVHA